MHLAVARERRLLAVERELAAGDRPVLERAAHQAGRGDGAAVVGERGRAGVGELAHLGQLLAVEALRDRGHEAGRDERLAARGLDERAEHGGRVDDRIGVRHREDRAVAARGGRGGAARDRLLVLAARRAQVHVRVDEGGREHARGRGGGLDARDHAVLDRDRDALAARGGGPRARGCRSGRSCRRGVMRPPRAPGRATSRSCSTAIRTASPERTCVEDQRVGRVGDAAVDLDAAVDRAGVHHLLAGAEPLGRDPPARGVLAQARHVGRLHPLALHPQHVDDVGGLDRADVGRGLAAERLDPARQERRRPDERRVRADERERLDERAGDAAVEDVADDRDVQPVERARTRSRIVKRSSSAWVGCWCLPSPALTTAAPE